ncbi:MAG TPA: tetratricopeptide repeat protein [Bdellovibrionota bacterium]|nr:tetratricopeptide repeat protein [Bdellovibrionota bacterium]
MSRWLLILIIASSAINHSLSHAADTSTGPAAPADAEILWNDGKAAFERGDFETAAYALKRIVDRYPGYPGYLEAHRLLGESFLRLDKPKAAIAPLKYYISGTRDAQNAARTRLSLGEAYLALKQFREAYLTALEIEKSPNPLPEGQLLRAQANIGLNRDAEALRIVSSVRKSLPPSAIPRASWIELRLKTRACSRLASRSPLEEGYVLEQMDRRSTCLLEAMLLFQKTLELENPDFAEKARTEMLSAYELYSQVCLNPPRPPGKKRSQIELKRYRIELSTLLRKKCNRHYQEASALLESWAPAKAALKAAAEPVLKRLRDLAE